MRAIAIIAVVLYHVFPDKFGGGFIGVDIFFVLSGYLISLIIFQEIGASEFSFVEFYSRRIRRIFPALLIVLIACLLAGWFLLFPDEYKQLGKHIAGGSSFLSNLILWNETSYFDNSADKKPLLHLWSLGVEEQFYIFFPLFIWVLSKIKYDFLKSIILLAVASLFLSITQVYSDPIAAFYSPLSRLWELLIGSILASINIKARNQIINTSNTIWQWRYSLLSRHVIKNFYSVLGLLAIIIGAILIDGNTRYPGVQALFPTLGAALLILGGENSWINKKLLSHPLLVWIGLISFPLYLIHYPILAFIRIIEGKVISLDRGIEVIIISLILSLIVYIIIEKPIRVHSKYRRLITLILFLLMLVIGSIGYLTTNYFYRFNKELIAIEENINFASLTMPDNMHIDSRYQFNVFGKADKQIIIYGDSHSGQYRHTLNEVWKRKHAQDLSPPEVMVIAEDFDKISDGLPLEKIKSDRKITKVVLSKFWAKTFRSNQVHEWLRCCKSGLIASGVVGGNGLSPLSIEREAELKDDLVQTVTTLIMAGKKVYIILDNPFGEEFDARSLAKRSFSHPIQLSRGGVNKDIAIARTEPTRSWLIKIAVDTGATIIDPFEGLCNENYCPAFSNEGELLYLDYDHLSLNTVKNRVRYLDFLLE